MGLNKIGQSLDRRLVNQVRNLSRNVRELKTPQPIGADILTVQPLPEGGYLNGGPLTLLAGKTGGFIVEGVPANSTLTLWNYLFTIAVDVNDAANYGFPGGVSLSSNQRLLRFWHWIDWATSSDVTNRRKFYFQVENLDSSTHDYYLFFRAYIPALSVSLT